MAPTVGLTVGLTVGIEALLVEVHDARRVHPASVAARARGPIDLVAVTLRVDD